MSAYDQFLTETKSATPTGSPKVVPPSIGDRSQPASPVTPARSAYDTFKAETSPVVSAPTPRATPVTPAPSATITPQVEKPSLLGRGVTTILDWLNKNQKATSEAEFKMRELMGQGSKTKITKDPITGKQTFSSEALDKYNTATPEEKAKIVAQSEAELPLMKLLNSPQAKSIYTAIGKGTSNLGQKFVARVKSLGDLTYEEAYQAELAKKNDPNNTLADNVYNGVLDSGAQSAVGILLGLSVSALSRGRISPTAVSAPYFASISANAQLEEKGKIDSVGNIAIDTVGDTVLSKFAETALKSVIKEGGTSFLKNVFKSSAKGFGVEGSTEVAQSFLKYANDYRNAQTEEEKARIVEETKEYVKNGGMATEFLVGGIAGGIITGGATAIGQKINSDPNINVEDDKVDPNSAFAKFQEEQKKGVDLTKPAVELQKAIEGTKPAQGEASAGLEGIDRENKTKLTYEQATPLADKATEIYWENKIKPEIESGKPVVIGADDLKDYFGNDYNDNNHPVYSQSAFKLFELGLQRVPEKKLILTAGGAGAGKTEIVTKQLINRGFKGMIYDSNLANYEGAVKQIEKAKEAGFDVEIYGVLPNLERARSFTILRQNKVGRGISDATFARGHAGFPAVLQKLLEEKKLKESEVKLLDTRNIDSLDKAIDAVLNKEYVKDVLDTIKNLGYNEDNIKQTYAKDNFDQSTGKRTKGGSSSGEGSSGVPTQDGGDRENAKRGGDRESVPRETKRKTGSGSKQEEGVKTPKEEKKKIRPTLHFIKGAPTTIEQKVSSEGDILGTPVFTYKNDNGKYVVIDKKTGLSLSSNTYSTMKTAIEKEKEHLVKKAGGEKELKAMFKKAHEMALDRYSDIFMLAGTPSGFASIGEFREDKKYRTTYNLNNPDDFEYLSRIFSEETMQGMKHGVFKAGRREGKALLEEIANGYIVSEPYEKPKLKIKKYEGGRTFYHGTSPNNVQAITSKGFKIGSSLPEDAFRSGGYGQMQDSVSFSSDPMLASRFTGSKSEGALLKVAIDPKAKIVSIPSIEDAVELNDYADDLKKEGVDAVWIGGGEQELVVLNPSVASVTDSRIFNVQNAKEDLAGFDEELPKSGSGFASIGRYREEGTLEEFIQAKTSYGDLKKGNSIVQDYLDGWRGKNNNFEMRTSIPPKEIGAQAIFNNNRIWDLNWKLESGQTVKEFLTGKYNESKNTSQGGSGYASIGRYREEGEIRLGNFDQIKPIRFPELLDLAKELSGNVPFIKKYKMANGMMYAKDGGYIGLNPDLFKRENLGQLEKTMAHEIGHLIDYLPDHTMTRGNVMGRLAVLKGFNKDFFAGAGATRTNSEVREQLWNLSKYWKPIDEATASKSFLEYRKSAPEVYADFISVLFNDPALAGEIAPTAYNVFFEQLDKKPEVKKAYFELQDLLHYGDMIAKRRSAVKRMFKDTEQEARERQIENQQLLEEKERSVWFKLKNDLIDITEVVREDVKRAQGEGKAINPDDNPTYYLEERNYIGGKIKSEVDTKFNSIYQRLQSDGMTWEDLGELMFYERILKGDRGDVANPLGYQPDFVQELMDVYEDVGQVKPDQAEYDKGTSDMKTTLGEDKFARLQELAKEYRSNLKTFFEEGYNEGIYNESLKKMFEENAFYVPFKGAKYSGVTRTTFGVKHQKGTLGNIENPANTGIEKAVSIIRAIERNKVSRKTIEFYLENFPSEVQEAERDQNGYPRDPRDKSLGLVTYMEDGKVKGYYVDAYIAEAIKKTPSGEMNQLIQAVRFFNSGLFRPLFITFNLGFQSFNLIRDFKRFWKNIPDMTILKAMKLYSESVRASKIRAFGLPENPTQADLEAYDLINKLESDKVISITYNDILKGEQIEDAQIDRILRETGVREAKQTNLGKLGETFGVTKDTPLIKQALGILEFIEKTGNLIETIPKVAGVKALEGTMSPIEMRSYVRKYIGSPDFLAGGRDKKSVNELFLFANAIAQGIRSDYEIATQPKTRGAYWLKTAKSELLPKLLMIMASAGLFGDWLKELFGKASEYDKANYTIIPLGEDENGKAVYFRMPSDETGRLIGGVFWKMAQSVQDPKKLADIETYTNLLNYAGGQVPSLSPIVGESLFTIPAFIAGQNPYDFFRGRPILTDEQQLAGGMERVKPFLAYLFQQMGGNVIMKLAVNETVPKNPSLSEKIVNLPLLSNVAGRFIKVTDYGETEKIRAISNEIRSENAKQNLENRRVVFNYVDQAKDVSPAERQALKRDMIREILGSTINTPELRRQKTNLEKRFDTLLIRGKADPKIDSLITAQSNEEKVALLTEFSGSMSKSDFEELRKFIIKNKVVSPEAYQTFIRSVNNTKK